MPEHFSLPEHRSDDSAEPQLSRKERRAKAGKQPQQQMSGKVRDQGRASVPPAKHMNYRRG
ncbi:hypothetical protein [Nocardia sp. NPDC020380]|uniref:hypothetical protein n=1 Tax=Nocardia sp. NPDC020380 TaxID=3364309 RepID=UPI0037A8475E